MIIMRAWILEGRKIIVRVWLLNLHQLLGFTNKMMIIRWQAVRTLLRGLKWLLKFQSRSLMLTPVFLSTVTQIKKRRKLPNKRLKTRIKRIIETQCLSNQRQLSIQSNTKLRTLTWLIWDKALVKLTRTPKIRPTNSSFKSSKEWTLFSTKTNISITKWTSWEVNWEV